MNKGIFSGRLTTNPLIEDVILDNHIHIKKATFSIKTNDDKALLIRCNATRHNAKIAEKELYKGRLVLVSGKLDLACCNGTNGEPCFAIELTVQDLAPMDEPVFNVKTESYDGEDLPF